jgi:hypothetical protein
MRGGVTRSGRRPKRSWAVTVAGGLLAGVLLGPGVARAHANLVEATPAAGAVDALPARRVARVPIQSRHTLCLNAQYDQRLARRRSSAAYA